METPVLISHCVTPRLLFRLGTIDDSKHFAIHCVFRRQLSVAGAHPATRLPAKAGLVRLFSAVLRNYGAAHCTSIPRERSCQHIYALYAVNRGFTMSTFGYLTRFVHHLMSDHQGKYANSRSRDGASVRYLLT